jgi:NAD(P)-dependent dehydrogenase (short-subunit alcohol dehydrogenase family)
MTSEAPRQSSPLSAPIALVTGATAYIGRAIALELARPM